MKTLAILNAVIFIIVYGIALFRGVNPQKRQTWLLGLYGFLTFFLVGIAGTGNVYESVKVGLIAAIAFTFGGIITYRNRERAKKWLRDHYGEDI